MSAASRRRDERSQPHLDLAGRRGQRQQRPLVTGRAATWPRAGRPTAPVWPASPPRMAGAAVVRWVDSGQAQADQSARQSEFDHLVARWPPYVRRVPGEEPSLQGPTQPEGAKWAEPLRVITASPIAATARDTIPPATAHLVTIRRLHGGAAAGDFRSYDDFGPLSTPDGSAIFAAVRKDNWEREPNDTDAGSPANPAGADHADQSLWFPDVAPAISPDGSKVAYLGF